MKYRKHEAKDAAKQTLKGVWTALSTSFTHDDKLDEAGNILAINPFLPGFTFKRWRKRAASHRPETVRAAGNASRLSESSWPIIGAVCCKISLVISIDESRESKSIERMCSGVGIVTTWSLTSPKKFSIICN